MVSKFFQTWNILDFLGIKSEISQCEVFTGSFNFRFFWNHFKDLKLFIMSNITKNQVFVDRWSFVVWTSLSIMVSLVIQIQNSNFILR